MAFAVAREIRELGNVLGKISCLVFVYSAFQYYFSASTLVNRNRSENELTAFRKW
jgi:hypothetical protein